MPKPVWTCRRCDWQGDAPSVSDGSYCRLDFDGNVIVDRVHYACCPQCFHAVRRDIDDPTGEYVQLRAEVAA